MAIVQITSREFRDKQASWLDRADRGEQIIIRRRGKRAYRLLPVSDDELAVTPHLQQQIEEAREQYRKGDAVTCRTKEELHAFLSSL